MTRAAAHQRRQIRRAQVLVCASCALSQAGLGLAAEATAIERAPGPGAESQAGSGSASAAEAAAEHFEAALAHVDRGEFDRAVIEFEHAYALSPHASVQYNLGLAHAALGQSQQAIRAFERFLAEGAGAIDAARRSRVAALIGAERARLGLLKLSVTPGHAVLLLDAHAALAQPEGILLDPGMHSLSVRAPGYSDHLAQVEIQSGATTVLNVLLTAQQAEPAAVPVIPQATPAAATADARVDARPEPGPSTDPWPVILLSTGGLALTAALATYLHANERHADWQERERRLPPVARTEAERRAEARNDDLEREIRRLDNIAIGCGAAGLALVAGAVWLHLSGDEPAGLASGALRLDVEGTSLHLRGWF